MNRLWVRLTLAFVAVMLVGAVTIAALVDWSAGSEFRQYLGRQQNLEQSGLLDDLATFYQTHGTWDNVGTVIANFIATSGRGRGQGSGRGRPPFILADANNRIVYDESTTRMGATLSANERAAAQTIVQDGKSIGYLFIDSPGRGALAPAEQSFLDQLRMTLLIAALIAGTLGIFLGLLISRTLAAPLSNLAQAARAFAAHDWNHRVKVQGADEIADVAREFNEMADELQRAETLRRNLMADIAHELRTPLTVLQGNLSAMLDDVYPLERSEIATLYDETRVLNRLVDDLRELALADAGQLRLNRQAVDVVEFLRSAATNFSVALDAQQILLKVQATEPLVAYADPDRLAQILRNLIANALRHTPTGGTIGLQCSLNKGAPAWVKIIVTDTGEGIARQDLPHVFERFYRSDKSRARESGGTGLGLAITKAWVEAMGGKVGMESELGRGAQFWFTLPCLAE